MVCARARACGVCVREWCARVCVVCLCGYVCSVGVWCVSAWGLCVGARGSGVRVCVCVGMCVVWVCASVCACAVCVWLRKLSLLLTVNFVQNYYYYYYYLLYAGYLYIYS